MADIPTENMVLRTLYIPLETDRQLKALAFTREVSKGRADARADQAGSGDDRSVRRAQSRGAVKRPLGRREADDLNQGQSSG